MPWPTTLPKLALTEDFTELPGDAAYRQDVDSGPARTRPRPDAPNDRLRFRQRFRSDQIDILQHFYYTTLGRGSLTFNEFHPRTGLEESFKFVGPPQYSRSQGIYNAEFILEIMP